MTKLNPYQIGVIIMTVPIVLLSMDKMVFGEGKVVVRSLMLLWQVCLLMGAAWWASKENRRELPFFAINGNYTIAVFCVFLAIYGVYLGLMKLLVVM
jgi:hypothetical protein